MGIIGSKFQTKCRPNQTHHMPNIRILGWIVIEIRWQLTNSISRDDRLCHFCSYDVLVVETKAHLLVEVSPIYLHLE